MVQLLKLIDNPQHLVIVYRKEEIEDSLFRYRVLHKIINGNYIDDPSETLKNIAEEHAGNSENITASIFSSNNGGFLDFEDLVAGKKRACKAKNIQSFTITTFLDSGSLLTFESLQSFHVAGENTENTESDENTANSENGENNGGMEDFVNFFEHLTKNLKEKTETNVKPVSVLFDGIFGSIKKSQENTEKQEEPEEEPGIYNNIFYSYEYGNKDRAFEEDDRKKNSFYHGLTSAEYFKFLKELQKIQVEHKASVKKLHTDYLEKQKELEIEKLRKRDQAYENFVRKARG